MSAYSTMPSRSPPGALTLGFFVLATAVVSLTTHLLLRPRQAEAVEVVDTGTCVRTFIDTQHPEDDLTRLLGWLRPPPPGLDARLAQPGSSAAGGAIPDGPAVRVVSDTRTGDGRRIELDITTAAGCLWSSLELGPREQLRAITLELDIEQIRAGTGERVVIEQWAPRPRGRLRIDTVVDVPVVLRVSELHYEAGQRPMLVTHAWSW